MFVPEIGFRRDDRHGWLRAWDWRHVQWRDESGDAQNYDATLRYLTELARRVGVRHLVIGVWNWNQREYGVGLEPDVVKVLKRYLWALNDPPEVGGVEFTVLVELVKSLGILPAIIVVLLYLLLRLTNKLSEVSTALRELASEVRTMNARLSVLVEFILRQVNDESRGGGRGEGGGQVHGSDH